MAFGDENEGLGVLHGTVGFADFAVVLVVARHVRAPIPRSRELGARASRTRKRICGARAKL